VLQAGVCLHSSAGEITRSSIRLQLRLHNPSHPIPTHPNPAEFVNVISAQANEIATADKKSTIMPEHVIKALEALGFQGYIEDVRTAWDQIKQESKSERRPLGGGAGGRGAVSVCCGSGGGCAVDVFLMRKCKTKPPELQPHRNPTPQPNKPNPIPSPNRTTDTVKLSGRRTKAEEAGLSEQEQIRMQQELFAQARARSMSLAEAQEASVRAQFVAQQQQQQQQHGGGPAGGEGSNSMPPPPPQPPAAGVMPPPQQQQQQQQLEPMVEEEEHPQ